MGNFNVSNYDIHTDDENSEEKIKILFFKSDHCAFCPAALERVRRTIQQFGEDAIELEIIDVEKDPDMAQKYGVLALPTIIIGDKSVAGVPDTEKLLSMILTARLTYGDDY